MNSNSITCPNCGETIHAKGDAFCVYCHSSLDGDDFIPDLAAQARKSIPDSCPMCSSELGPDSFQTQRVPWYCMIIPLLANLVAALVLALVFMAVFFSLFRHFFASISGIFLAGAFYLKYMRPKWHENTTLTCLKCNWKAIFQITNNNSP